MSSVQEIEDAALKLSLDERLQLLDALSDSVRSGGPKLSADGMTDDEVGVELSSREEEADREGTWLDGEQVLAELRNRRRK